MSKKKLLAMLTGMVMAFMGLAGVGAASADNSTIPGAPRADQPAKASLTVHKYMGATTDVKNDGTELNAAEMGKLTSQKPLAGIKFNLYKVDGVDINTNKGLELATKLAKIKLDSTVVTGGIKDGTDTYKLTPAGSGVTDAGGTVKFADKERGLYVVVEDVATSDANAIKAGGKKVEKDQITPIAPFALTLPMTSPDGKTWNDNVHVYPKNQVDELTKAVSDKNVKVGDNFFYTLSATSTPTDSNKDGKLDKGDLGGVYEFYDELPANVSYVGTTATIAGADQTENTDFKVTTDGNKITVSFQGDALDKIAKGVAVEVKITVKLNKVPESGLTENTGKLYPNKWKKDKGEGIPSNKVVTKHGDIVIKKVDEGGTKPLSGAVFEVRLADTTTKSCSDLSKLGPVIKTSKATGDDGLVKISDLQLTNFIDGKAVDGKDQVPYCLVEKTAPAGYQLLPKAIEFKLTKEGTVTDLAGAIEANAGNATTIKNYKNPGLPLTGAQGILLVSALGLILVSVGVVLTVKRRKD
ncbi:SpaH/EbpB family LPXTG-anchored major pilin [Varibaculum massiliense]|uniref:SpaH/EbpB family LPXTG-anchored major pilin n=1 Tax=Varibaculum massiliense TaxID=1852372 RepID=UPI002889F8E8|nr:SpaH/EbpB family LPXTG-anchored major pilin [Varibaculum massiliense]